MGFPEEDHRGNRHSHHIVSGSYYQFDLLLSVDLDHVAEIVFVRFFHSEVALSLLFISYSTLWKEVPKLNSFIPHYLFASFFR